MSVLYAIGDLLAFYALVCIAGARHHSARPDQRRNTQPRGNRNA